MYLISTLQLSGGLQIYYVQHYKYCDSVLTLPNTRKQYYTVYGEMGGSEWSANLKKSDICGILAEVLAASLKIEFFFSSQRKNRFVSRPGLQGVSIMNIM
jgi:hypothetical protein